jgi:hypothetical protein
METRRSWAALMAVVVSVVALAPWPGAALPIEPGVDPVPVHGLLSPQGTFVGHLTVTHVTVSDTGRLHLTGVLHGTATDRSGATTRVRTQTFTASATVMPSDRTTDVLLLRLAPMALASAQGRLTLAPIPLDVDAVPDGGDMRQEGEGDAHDPHGTAVGPEWS